MSAGRTRNDHWARLDVLFSGASEIAPEGRVSWLAEACGGDKALEQEVLSLLHHASVAEADLDDAVAGEAGALLDSRSALRPGDSLGSFRIVREIGRGGMGTVYQAERIGGEIRQTVAIKVVRSGMHSRQILGRFWNERRILADLNHPNIATFLDGGSTPDGRPWVGMEYVEGVPILQYADDRHLDLAARLRLFLAVCSAVDHAHGRMVIHRDIKPANILVTADGVPKLLDFGIAKILDPSRADEHGGLTRTGVRLMTPEYAAPEQVLGQPVSAATDVYALGAVLYELLCGARAHRITGLSALDAERAICIEEIRLPSEAAGDAKRKRQLAGDLDRIVQMAMRKERDRRYPSAAQFADDIVRYLDGLPVLARRGTWSYLTGKFLRRNGVLVAAAALVFVSLAIGVSVSLYQAHQAERRFQQVRGLATAMLFEYYPKTSDLPGSTEARRTLVSITMGYLNSLADDAGSDHALQVDLVRGFERAGNIAYSDDESNVGDIAAARDAWGKALRIGGPLATQSPELLPVLARAGHRLGYLDQLAGDDTTAARRYDEAVQTARRAYAAIPASLVVLESALNRRGDLYVLAGEPEKALQLFREALPPPSADPRRNPDLSVLQRIAEALVAAGRMGEAEAASLLALEHGRELLALDPGSQWTRKVLADLEATAGEILLSPAQPQDRRREAAAHFREGLRMVRADIAGDPRNNLAKIEFIRLATGLLSAVAPEGGEEAAGLSGELSATLDAKAPDPADLEGMDSRAAALGAVGEALGTAGRTREANAAFDRALEIAESLCRWSPRRVLPEVRRAGLMLARGRTEIRHGDRVSGQATLVRAVELCDEGTGRWPRDARLEAISRASRAQLDLAAR